MASDSLRGRFVSCDLTDPGCVTSSIERAGLRLVRRPLDPAELKTYQRVYESARALGEDEPAAFTLVLQTLLSSAEFIYRIERDPAPESTAGHPLGPFELASRLSYFLWSSAPDDALLDAASNGSLLNADVLSATVDRLLADAKSERFVANFAGQWLGAREVLSHPVGPSFVQWSRPTAHAASQEILLYFSDFLRSGRSWFDFPEADVNFVDDALAYFYGIATEPTGVGKFQRVEYSGDDRAGFFGLAGFLSVTSLDRRTSPSRRGRWIVSNLLCREPPPPPPVVPMLEGDQPVRRRHLGAGEHSSESGAASPESWLRRSATGCSIPTGWRWNSTTPSAAFERPTAMARRWTPRPRCRLRRRTPTEWSSRDSTGSPRPSRPTRTLQRVSPGSC